VAAFDAGAGTPELVQLLGWLRVHTLRLSPDPEEDEHAALVLCGHVQN
jgi:hypothetical protein